MKTKIIAIAGGSGAGKTTVTHGLLDAYPERIDAVYLDDYMFRNPAVQKVNDMINWDHPDMIDFSQLKKDLVSLQRGNSFKIHTKNKRDNPDFRKIEDSVEDKSAFRKEITIKPKPLIILEGFLALYDASVREILSGSVFLDLNQTTRTKRRSKIKNESYTEHILVPMHTKYVEPTKKYAEYVVEVDVLSRKQVIEHVEAYVRRHF